MPIRFSHCSLFHFYKFRSLLNCFQDYESDEKLSITDDRISHLLPTSYQDMIVRVYSKKPELVCWLSLGNSFMHSFLFPIKYWLFALVRLEQFLRLSRIFSWRLMGSKHKYTPHQIRKNAGFVSMHLVHFFPSIVRSFYVPVFTMVTSLGQYQTFQVDYSSINSFQHLESHMQSLCDCILARGPCFKMWSADSGSNIHILNFMISLTWKWLIHAVVPVKSWIMEL